jgi:dolichyl-phosphate-mannose-protein mannosyltransferase
MSQPSRNSASPVSRVELLLVVVISLAGFALRAAYPSRLAVEHFDEGVYASNYWFGQEEDYRYPNQFLYAPPLLPSLIELVFTLFGSSNAGAMVVNILAGSLTVPLLWWVGRCWFGPSAGLAAMTLCAFSDIHIFFSRTALTDVLLCFLLVAAVYLIRKALLDPTPVRFFGAGLVSSLAWWTKYSGWLPLAVGGSGIFIFALARIRGDSLRARYSGANPIAVRKLCWRWGIIAATAVVLWLPFLWSIQDRGGYAAVAANHRGYLVPWRETLAACQMQMLNYAQLAGWPTLFGHGIVGAWLIFGFGPLESSAYRNESNGTERSTLAQCLLLTWGLGTALALFLYVPYPRLMLPFLSAATLTPVLVVRCLTATCCRQKIEQSVSPSSLPTGPVQKIAAFVLLVLLVCMGWFITRFSLHPVPGWQSRTGLADLANPIIADACRHAGLNRQTDLDELIIDTYGEPALLFQLSLAGVDNVFPVSHLGFARPDAPRVDVPAFVVIGEHARRSAGFDQQFAESKARLELVAEYGYHPSDLVLLDNREANRRPQPGGRVVEKFELYRVR